LFWLSRSAGLTCADFRNTRFIAGPFRRAAQQSAMTLNADARSRSLRRAVHRAAGLHRNGRSFRAVGRLGIQTLILRVLIPARPDATSIRLARKGGFFSRSRTSSIVGMIPTAVLRSYRYPTFPKNCHPRWTGSRALELVPLRARHHRGVRIRGPVPARRNDLFKLRLQTSAPQAHDAG